MGAIQQEFEKLSKQIKIEVEKQFKKEINTIVGELKAATPIDTGFARNSWKVSLIENKDSIITNDAPYIDKLNHGSSKQAPSFFIESVALRHGKPIGTIVTNKS